MMEKVKLFLAAVLLFGLVFGTAWCQWAGYKDRYPHGGCIGFVTSCDGGRKK